jgi:hypothetical protein
MSDRWRKLQIGDRVRLLRVPESDLRQRERELRTGAEMPGWTADTLERIIAINPVVTIDEIDEYGAPWFRYELAAPERSIEYHSLTITEDESWEPADT